MDVGIMYCGTWDIYVGHTMMGGQGGEPRKLIHKSFIKSKCEVANKISEELNVQINYFIDCC